MRTGNIYLFCLFLLFSCGNNDEENSTSENNATENEVKIENGIKTVYFKGTKKIRFVGRVNKKNLWEGKVSSYRENGLLWSSVTYVNGIKNGVAQVYHPNGKLYYSGEYEEDQQSGVWFYYNKEGKFVKELTYEKKYE